MAQGLLAQLPGLLSFLAAAADSGRSGGPPGCVLVAAAAGHDGDAAVVAIAHVMRARRMTCYEALLLASRRRAALQLKVRAVFVHMQIEVGVSIWGACSAVLLECCSSSQEAMCHPAKNIFHAASLKDSTEASHPISPSYLM